MLLVRVGLKHYSTAQCMYCTTFGIGFLVHSSLPLLLTLCFFTSHINASMESPGASTLKTTIINLLIRLF